MKRLRVKALIKTYYYAKHHNKNLSEHFEVKEFVSSVNGQISHDEIKVDTSLIKKLEKFFNYGIEMVCISSGYRNPSDSVKVGGMKDDAHTKGIAADIVAYKGGKMVSAKVLSCLAELIGFSGIGIISSNAIHVDVRTRSNYKNAHWFGNEITGENNIRSFFVYYKTEKAKIFGELRYFKEKCFMARTLRKTPVRVGASANSDIKHYDRKGHKMRVFAVLNGYAKNKGGWTKLKDLERLR